MSTYRCRECQRSFASYLSWERHCDASECGWLHVTSALRAAVELAEHLDRTPDWDVVGNVRMVILRQAVRVLRLASEEPGDRIESFGSPDAIREELGDDWLAVAAEFASSVREYSLSGRPPELLPDIWKRAVYLVHVLDPSKWKPFEIRPGTEVQKVLRRLADEIGTHELEEIICEIKNAKSAEIDEFGDVWVTDAGGGHWLDEMQLEHIIERLEQTGILNDGKTRRTS